MIKNCRSCAHADLAYTDPPCDTCTRNAEPKEMADLYDNYVDNVTASVVHPSHYAYGRIEVWDAIIDWGLDFVLGNVVKYVARAGHKNNKLEDLKKARFYIEKAIMVEQAKEGEEQ